MALQEKLKGTGVAVVTPFDKSGGIDFQSYEKLLNHIIDRDVEYVVALGTTGETPVLDMEEKIQIINSTYSIVNGRVPVVIGVGGNHTASVIKDLQNLPLEQAAAVLSASPYYNKPSQEGIFHHYKTLAEVSPRPVILYNVPGRTGRNMTAATTLRLAREVSNIAGIKEASGDLLQCMEILKDRPSGFLVLSGDDGLALPQMACGMDGVISVAANCFPKEFSTMIRDCLKQDFISARKLNDTLMEAYDLLFTENNPAGAKAFLFEMGIIRENELRLPLVPLSRDLQGSIRKYLEVRPQS
jgi:4-hydroxy-tetrahydrodipicolinate synthase